MLVCPSCSWTVFKSAPAAWARLAAPWRRSCSRTGGSPESVTRRRRRRVSQSGCSGELSGGGEHVPGVLPCIADGGPFGLLPAQMGAQQPHGGAVQGDGAAAGGGLGWADGDGVAVGEALLVDHDDL